MTPNTRTAAEGGDRPEREAEAHNGRCPECGVLPFTLHDDGCSLIGKMPDRPANPQPLGGEYEQVRALIENAWLEHDGPQSVRDPVEVAAEHIIAHYADLEERLSVMRGALERMASNPVSFSHAAAQLAAQALSSIPGKSDV